MKLSAKSLNEAESGEPNVRTASSLRQLAVFVIVGGTNTAITYLIYAALVCLGLHYNVALALDYVVGTAFGYFLHRRWTFGHSGRHAESLSKFVASCIGVFFLNLALLNAIEWTGFVGPLVGQMVALALSAVFAFLVQKLWVFRPVPVSLPVSPTPSVSEQIDQPIAAPHFVRRLNNRPAAKDRE
jgi:putative flippase GtrA